MKNMLYKEIKLVTHPTTLIFLSLSAMMLIPNYPYYVTFFYSALGIFFMCLNGRENHDIFYTMTLPIRKKDIVKGRFLFVIAVELVQLLAAIPFALIRRTFTIPDNEVGIEANIAFFGLSLIMLGLFNLVFFTRYYKDPNKVGFSFALSSIIIAVYMILAETSVHVIPFMRDCIDTKDPQFLFPKLIFLTAGIIIYICTTYLGYRKSIKSFVALDL